MIDKIGHIKNPLTIIAIFAGLAEVGGTIVLPLLDPAVQSTYVWFLMLFPTILVGVFFWLLYKKHEVLYAPSDYRDDSTFREIVQGRVTADQQASSTRTMQPTIDASEEPDSELAFDALTPAARKVLKTLWHFQIRHFHDNEINRWAFGIAIGSPDYPEYQRGLEQLLRLGLVAIGPRGLCFLTNSGMVFCRSFTNDLDQHEDIWSTFTN